LGAGVRQGTDREVQPIFDEFRVMLDRLRVEGYRVRATCQAAPVQLEGFLPSGEAFYFRCRWETCRLDVAPANSHPIREPAWQRSITRWHQYDASCLDSDETESVLRELVDSYRADVR
jgi:hypothetical protein